MPSLGLRQYSIRQCTNKKYPCCQTESKLSIFLGGVTPNELEGIKATNIAEFFRSTLRYNFKHVKKEVNWGNMASYISRMRRRRYRGTAIIAGGPVATPNPNATPATPNPNSNAVTAAATPNANPNAVTAAATPNANPNASPNAYNIFESSDQFIIYVEACGVARNTIEIEVNKFDAQRIYIKFNYDQDIEDGLHCLKRSFFVPKDEIKMLIQLPKSFDPDKDAKVELLCGMIKISLGKLEKLITKKFKIY
ncbi:hypothetical protein GLOIN_2v1474512 [Rhizophagus irregularis DAOM 181602=DAOM 197198]|nr:hypothetical protein GLOIN_2v1474512 [Rhizophagus irregularis DAOM 181602=DAOM 197198]